ncbi:MAG: Tn3 family transposase [Anaerolineales bacterium]|nr:Tn3 family transposase [Anaerolineales bacterium]
MDHAVTPPDLQAAPREVIQAAWRSLVIDPNQKINRRYYTFCVLHHLMEALRRRDMFVSPSNRWHDLRRKLLQGKQWEQARPKVCRILGWTTDGKSEIQHLSASLDETYRRVTQNFADNEAARIEQESGRDRLVLSPLTKLEELDSLLPSVNLPEAMLEIHRRTGFADEFTHISETKSYVEDFSISVCAALLAEACNIGLEPVARPDIPALTKGRLLWVQQNYIRA